MKRLIFSTLIMLTACATSFAQYEDIFANFTIDPAEGSTLTDREFRHVTITFNDVHNISINSSSDYKIYPEEEYAKKGDWGLCIGHYLGEPSPTFLDYEGVCEINDNVVSINIREMIPEAGVYYLVFDGGTFFCGHESNDEIAVKYTITKEEIKYTVTPSNAEPVNLLDLWPINFTFEGVKNITLNDDIFNSAEVQILDEEGNVIVSHKERMDDKYWTVDGNKMKVEFVNGERKNFTKDGKYTILFTAGSLIFDGSPQGELRIVYDVIIPERPAEGPVELDITNYLDEENRLVITIPENYTCNGYYNKSNSVYDAAGNKVGHLGFVEEVDETRRQWYLPVVFDTEKDANAVYNVSIHEELLLLVDFLSDDHPTAAKELVFYPSKEAAGINNIEADDSKTEYYTLEGIRTTMPEAGKVYVERINGKTKKIVMKK